MHHDDIACTSDQLTTRTADESSPVAIRAGLAAVLLDIVRDVSSRRITDAQEPIRLPDEAA